MRDAAAELRAQLETAALVDRSIRARLLGTGPDLLGLLQRLGTGDVAHLTAGQGRATVLTTNKGRIVERLFVSHLGPSGVLLVGSAGAATRVLEHLSRYTFAERTGLADVTGETALFAILGPRAAAPLGTLRVAAPAAGGAVEAEIAGTRVHVLGHDGLSAAAFSVLAPAASAAAVRASLRHAIEGLGGREAGAEAAEARRILLGLPDAPGELNEEHNPLEAGLWDAVSFDKGCYVGQEVVARLRTYDKVARRLLGVRLAAPPPDPGARVTKDGIEVGSVTSAAALPGTSESVALAYVKSRLATPGDEVEIAGAGAARLVAATEGAS